MVGAGPAGSTAAHLVAKRGFKTLLCEEHDIVGRPCHCTGKLTAHAFQEFDLPQEAILNSVRAAVLHAPRGTKLQIRRDTVDSYILDRVMFDFRLAEGASSSGAELSLQTRVYDLHRSPDGLIVLKAKREGAPVELKSRLVIDAEGATPILPKMFGLQAERKLLSGIQYEMSDIEIDSPDTVELYFGREVAPGFLAWIVPVADDRARIGLCIRGTTAIGSPRKYLERFLNHNSISGKVKSGRIEKVCAGVEPIHGPVTPTYSDRILAVGDSAGQVKSTSGGGIYFGLKAAKLAGETTVECLERDETSKGCLGRYELGWKRSFGWELRSTSLVRKILDGLTDDEVDRVFQIIADDRIKRLMEAYGDTAFQSRLLRPILPEFVKKSLKKASDMVLLAKLLSSGLANLIT